MGTPIFPSALPGVSRVTLRPDSGVITDDGDGVKSFRRRSAVPMAAVDAEWVFVDTDYSLFLTFCRDTLLGFHRWFWLKLPSAGGVTWHVVRFAQGEKPSSQMNGHGAWTVSAKLDIRERAFEAQPEPPVDPEQPEGEPNVLSFLLTSNSNSYPFDASRVDPADFTQKTLLSTADYATFDTATGGIVLTQTGIYELLCSIAFATISINTEAAVMGAEVTLTTDESDVSAYPFSFPLVNAAAVNQSSGVSTPTVTIHKLINLAVLLDSPVLKVAPFCLKENTAAGTYIINSIAGSLRRLGASAYLP